jgi:hypothetical protein
MTATADAILAELTLPGRTLAFCDETDLTTVPTATMVGDIHAWVAAILPSESYVGLETALISYRAQHGLPEFHGTEIVNPKSGTLWKAVPFDQRVDAYRFACGLVVSHASELLYSYIGKGQYADLLATHPDNGIPNSHKDAVKRVFRGSIISHLAWAAPAVLVFDKDKNNAGATLEPLPGCNHLVGGGIVRASSHVVAGLQVADVAAYAIGRYLKRRDKIVAEAITPFDTVNMEMLANLNGRIHYLD